MMQTKVTVSDTGRIDIDLALRGIDYHSKAAFHTDDPNIAEALGVRLIAAAAQARAIGE